MKGSHWNKPSPRCSLIDDINEWIRWVTNDPKDGLPENTRMTRHELETICRAISYVKASPKLYNDAKEPL